MDSLTTRAEGPHAGGKTPSGAGRHGAEISLEDILETRVPERRLVGRVLAYWNGQRGERLMPSICDIEGDGLGRDWDHCFIIDVRPQFRAPSTVHLGTELQRLSGALVDRRVNAILEILLLTSRKITEVREVCGPVLAQDEFPLNGQERMLARGVFLPLGEDTQTVTFVLGAANGKIVPAIPGL